MAQTEYQRELLAFDEKIALAELEEAKASERIKELEYQRARFNMDYFIAVQKEQQARQQASQPPAPETLPFKG